ncbi:MAG: tetratricopeptide repeat protein [Myxococcales bacterium]|jgi:hypothetical protein
MRLATCGLIAVVVALPGAARAGLFEGNHPKVKAGTEAFNKGDYEGALRLYEEADKELPHRPELLYNLGDVYMKLGRTDDAKRAFEAALGGADDSLKARDYFNLGNAFVGLNQTDDAIAAYRQALKVDPNLEPARRNLELLLRKLKQQPPPEKKPTPGDGGTPDAGVPDAGQDGGQGDASQQDQQDAGQDGGQGDAGGPDGGQLDAGLDGGADAGADGGQSDGGQGDGGAGDGGGEADAGSPDAGEQQDGGGGQGKSEQPDGGSPDAGEQDGGVASAPEETSVEPENVDRQKAEQLLDAVRRNEKQFLMHQHKRKGKKSARPEKDW